MSAKEFISIDDYILTEVPIDNVNDIIQRYMNNDSSDDDECNINQDISDKELPIKSYGSFLISRIRSIQRESIVIVKKFELEILTNLHVLDLLSPKNTILELCLSVNTITRKLLELRR
ncbi:hypothetical protein AVEN_240467-1 [Araneus ventricosus]|uniref:Uncharacterized protein n=1 Tax=Araneus ventricosus TaxID=182803 RepID=A0A4Y2KVT8_ARAVE|nr:hypothetical protein AVEN_240467-1 [Araneus ventricosus]